MQHLPKKGAGTGRKDVAEADEPAVSPEKETKDEKEAPRSYYYDDAYGYEDYDPESGSGPSGKDDEK